MELLNNQKIGVAIAALLLFILMVRVGYVAIAEPRNLARPGYILRGMVMAHPPGGAPLEPEAMPDWTAASKHANMAAGRALSSTCQGCHDLSPAAKINIGPPLYGVVGRARGSLPGFRYSPAMLNSKEPWTSNNLFEFLRDPQLYVPGTRMSLDGMPSAQQRIDLIAYLQSLE